MAFNIAVCIKPVPDPDQYDKIKIDPDTKLLIRKGIPTVLNPDDKHAIEAALKLKDEYGGKVSLFSMAPRDAVEILRDGLAMGADEAYLLCDRAFAGADTLATSYTLSMGIKKAGKYDLVFLGSQSADGGTSQVPAQLGEWLNFAHVDNIEYFAIQDETSAITRMKIESGYIEYRVEFPAVFSVRRELNTPRYTSFRNIIRAKSKKIEIWDNEDLGLDLDMIGLKGSPTQPGEISIPDHSRKGEEIIGTPEEIAEELLKRLLAAGVHFAKRGAGS